MTRLTAEESNLKPMWVLGVLARNFHRLAEQELVRDEVVLGGDGGTRV
jgi:hypothetical protein